MEKGLKQKKVKLATLERWRQGKGTKLSETREDDVGKKVERKEQ